MPILSQTVIIENHPSVLQYPDTIDQYLADEVHAGRMSGPFSRDATNLILRGPFFSSPLIVSVQTQAPGIPDKLRVCRHLSKSNKTNPSVNSYLNKEDFPTRFDTASRVADIVSNIFMSWPLVGERFFSSFLFGILFPLFPLSFSIPYFIYGILSPYPL